MDFKTLLQQLKDKAVWGKIIIFALPLVIILLLVLTSIDTSDKSKDSPPINNGHNGDHIHDIDLDTAMTFFPPDTIMMSAGDASITWAEFYVFLHNAVSQLSYNFMIELDWEEEFFDNKTVAESILEYTTDHALELLVFEYASTVLGVSLGQEDFDIIQEDIDYMLADAESLEALEEGLHENGFLSLEVYRTLRLREFIPWLLLSSLYGDDLSDISDDTVAEFAEFHKYMRAQHILLAFLRAEDGHSAQEIEDNKIELRAQIDNILDRLNERAGDNDFFDFFEELMWEYGEDPGMFSSPDGYLFQPNDMVAPFSEACAAILPGQLSDVVTTSYGYHIILRLPINYDEIPFSMIYAGYNYSLRMLAIIDDFENRMEAWRESMNVVFSPEYYSINLSEMFLWDEH